MQQRHSHVVVGSSLLALAEVTEELRKRGLPLVALVNNAGIARGGLPLEFEPETAMREVMETNFFGAVGVTQTFLPLLRSSKGRIVMVSSVAGVLSPLPTSGTYGASKHALEAVSDALRRELAPAGVSVSVIEPAYVQSSIGDNSKAVLATYPKELFEASRKVYPWIPDMRALSDYNVKHGDSPQVTTDVIVDAIESPTPSTRYVVATIIDGKLRLPATVVVWLEWLLPDRLMDALTRKVEVDAPPPAPGNQ